jgi:hypothetical protein
MGVGGVTEDTAGSTGNDQKSESDYEMERFRWYREERRYLLGLERESERSYDKAVLTFASGVLVYAVVEFPVAFSCEYWPIQVAKIVLLIGLSAILVSYRLNSLAVGRALKNLEQKYRGEDGNGPSNNGYAKAISVLNWVSMVLLIAGVALVLVQLVTQPQGPHRTQTIQEEVQDVQ